MFFFPVPLTIMLEKLLNHSLWEDYLKINLDNEYLSKKEKKKLQDFISNKKYLEIASRIISNDYTFSIPKKHIISKISTSKKRIVYTYNEIEMMMFKYITFLLYDYDYLFTPNLYSFRRNTGVKNAIYRLKKDYNLRNMYGYKVDISNYFNSIDPVILLSKLKDNVDNDLYDLFKLLLLDKRVCFKNEIIEENKGVMAGVPISSFLANFYIKDIDKYFYDNKIKYYRYADDIIMFASSRDELDKNINILYSFFSEYNLNINHDKEYFFSPNERIEFLGFSFDNGVCDLSQNIVNKIKGKIRRSARGYRRYMFKKGLDEKTIIKALIRKYNAKFFGRNNNELSWKYWYFPLINTARSLQIIDNYFQEYLRYIATGRHNKRNYSIVPYQALKELGYRSLVHEYYLFLNMENKV